ncbi:MAG: hypothetical protein P8X95_12600 [Anaerolineales bacterium]|jgi:hypothetical protein
MFKKLSIIFASLALAFASFGFSSARENPKATESGDVISQSSTAITGGELVNQASGNEGVYMPKSGYNGTLMLSRLGQEEANHVPQGLRFSQPLVNFSVDLSSNHPDPILHGQTYVYFNLSKTEMSAWKKGDLSIYWYNPTTQSWTAVPTSFDSHGNTGARVYTLATSFGTYGVGIMH